MDAWTVSECAAGLAQALLLLTSLWMASYFGCCVRVNTIESRWEEARRVLLQRRGRRLLLSDNRSTSTLERVPLQPFGAHASPKQRQLQQQVLDTSQSSLALEEEPPTTDEFNCCSRLTFWFAWILV